VKKVWWIFTAGVTIAMCLSAKVCDAAPVNSYGQLKVVGNRIVDKNDTPVQLHGMSLFWSQWMSKYWNANVVRWLVSDWKISVIRASMAVESGGFLANPDGEKQKVRTIVDAAISQGIYVIIDWHDHNATSHTNQAKGFFEEMARTYGSNPHVIYEIFNEPDDESWTSQIKPYSETIIQAIRAIDPDNLIIVGTPTWSQDVVSAANDPIIGTNIAYTLHFYATTHKEPLRQKARSALSKGIALFVTEWGACEASGDGPIDYAETDRWMAFLDTNMISSCNWAISDKPETSSALNGGADNNGGWQESNLTASGKLVRNQLRAYAEKPSRVIPRTGLGAGRQSSNLPSRSYGLDGRVLPTSHSVGTSRQATPAARVKIVVGPDGVARLKLRYR
jgi:endoglucanase